VSAVGFQSDSYQLVETCLARLRIDAELDELPVLPTIDLLPEGDIVEVDTSELVIVCSSVRELPSAASIVRESVKANQKDVPTLRRMRAAAPVAKPVRPARWPVVLCALVATYFGTAAFLESPLGAKPEVRQVIKVSRDRIAGAVRMTKSFVRL
jgi:hypothetical protein